MYGVLPRVYIHMRTGLDIVLCRTISSPALVYCRYATAAVSAGTAYGCFRAGHIDTRTNKGLRMPITNMIPSIWSSRIIQSLEKNLVFGQPGVSNTDYEGEIRADGDRVYVHRFNDLTIFDYVKNTTTISYEQLTDARVTLVIDQSKAFAFKVDDIDAVQMRPKLLDAAADRASYQLADRADQFLAGKYVEAPAANTIATSVFSASTVYDKFVDLATKMDEGNVPEEGRFAVVPPWVKNALLKNSNFLTAKSDAVLNGQVGSIAGINILVSNNVVVTGTAPAVSHIIAGVPSALSFAQQIVNVEGLRLEGSFSDAVRGLHLYGASVLVPELFFDLRANQ